MKVIVLKCPQCGAQIESSRTHCEHCGTTVKLDEDKQNFVGTGIACPQCNANNQINDKHCGSCGENLIAICPVPNCHTENNVWRKFCRKCGRNIIGFHIEMLENAQAQFKEKIQHHSAEIDRIQKDLPGSKGRETGIKLFILIIGVLISVAFLSSNNNWTGVVITLIITGIIAGCYHSSEDHNLLNSLALHKEDLERLQQSYEINEMKLTHIKSGENKTTA
jgi:hypothetical protein